MKAKVTPADSRGGAETSQRRKSSQPRSIHGEYIGNTQWEKQGEHTVGVHQGKDGRHTQGSTQWEYTREAHRGNTVGVHRGSTQEEHIRRVYRGNTLGGAQEKPTHTGRGGETENIQGKHTKVTRGGL